MTYLYIMTEPWLLLPVPVHNDLPVCNDWAVAAVAGTCTVYIMTYLYIMIEPWLLLPVPARHDLPVP